jgi:hypothetical protein
VGGYPADRATVGSRPEGGVEVDDVEPLCPQLFKSQRSCHRIVAVHGLAGWIAFDQSDHLATTQIDGRDDDHAATSFTWRTNHS